MGVLSFVGHTFITEEALALMPDRERALYGEFPFWTTVVFAIAVFTGLAGCIGLLLRRAWAKPVFIISLLAIIIQMAFNVFFTSAIEVYGIVQACVMPILVILFGVFLTWFSTYAIRRRWLR